VFGNVEHLGATLPGPGYKDWQAFLMEIVLTGALLSVILGTASARGGRRVRGRWLYRPGGPVVSTGERHLDEPGALIRPGAGQRRLDGVLGIRRRTADRRGDRGRVRDHPPRPGGDPISRAAGSGVLTPGELAAKAKLTKKLDEGQVAPPGLDQTTPSAVAPDARS